jgi:hypothetical protein
MKAALSSVVEVNGLEPSTSCLQSRRSPKLSYTPVQMTDIRVQMSDTAPGIDRQRSIVHAASLTSDF